MKLFVWILAVLIAAILFVGTVVNAILASPWWVAGFYLSLAAWAGGTLYHLVHPPDPGR